ncbi:MAG: phage tail sheath subtilisin-like domain-containing protein [Gemmatimonadaceae bacterium]|nr:phage tail sheath subtilisin-like domain-containing protein [Gemmatimonadaceae bacterium]
MPEYLSPAVYVEEVDTGSKPIEGVSTSTAGMVGVTERGPVNVPILVTSMGEFTRWFGEPLGDVEFRNANGFHCYLPHAVQGFFTNGGKRVYVTRVLRDDARASVAALFDRGGPASVASRLLRSTRAGTGTLVNQPLVSILAPAALAAGDAIRIGNGSQSEYRTLAANPVASTHVALSFPLAHAHDAGTPITDVARLLLAPFTAPCTLAAATPAGTATVTLTEGVAGEAAFLAAGQVLEFGAAADAEHRRIERLSGAGASRTVVLDAPLVLAHAAATAVTPLNVAGGAATTLLAAANARDSVIFGDAIGADFTLTANLVVFEAGTAQVEVRRIADLHQLALLRSTYDAYPRGSTVSEVTVTDDRRTLTAASVVDTITIDDVAGLEPGQRLRVDPGGAPEVRTIRSVDTTALTVTFTVALAGPHGAGQFVEVLPTTLTAATAVADVSIPLASRLGLGVGDVLRIGVAPDAEFATVAALTGDPAAPPNAGAIVLAGPLAIAHANGATVQRVRVGPAAVVRQPASLVLDAAADSDVLVVSENFGFALGDMVEVTTPSGLRWLHALSAAAAAVVPMEVELDAPLDRSHELGAEIAQRTAMIGISAIDAGRWGDRLRISVEDEANGLVSGATLAIVNSPTDIRLSSPTGVEPGTVLELIAPAGDDTVIGGLLKVAAINRSNNRITLAAPLSAAQNTAYTNALGLGQQLRVRSREFRLSVLLMRRPDPMVPSRDDSAVDREVFANLSMDPRHSRYFLSLIGDVAGVPRLSDGRPDGGSWYVRAEDLAANAAAREAVRLGPETLVDRLPSGMPRAARHALAGGDDSLALLDDTVYIGVDAVDPGDRTGLQALKNIEEVSIVAIPGRTATALQGALISHCEEMRFRFAVLDSQRAPLDAIADVRAQRQQFDTKYAALYYPWLLIPQPFPTVPGPTLPYMVPPAGHMVGVYARTDIERGVHKAPANEVVRGIVGLQRSLSKGEHDILNPYPVNINVIRDFRSNSRGIRAWGGRVITSDSDWKYVNVRRLMIFIEQSVERGLQWVVFEPNAEPLWARVVRTISNFLRTVWRNGALEGTKVEEAFFVRCDRSTMTQAEIDNGQLICLVGIAPVKPAEFVIVRIGLWTAHTSD